MKTETNRINLRDLITVTGLTENSDGIHNRKSFKLVYPNMVVEVKQYIPIEEGDGGFNYISSIRKKAIASLSWWRRLFLTPLKVNGLCIQCYIPQHRKNGY